jgi:DNA gyrase subunit B
VNASSEYTAKQIVVLEGLEPVRKRPGMYIGGTGLEGLHHLVWEVLDNAIDEAMAGHATRTSVTLLPDNRVEVSDNGRGIPVDTHAQTKLSALETVMTTLHAGGKFGSGGYKVSGGLHGVGVSVVNALSKWMQVDVYRDGARYTQTYERGKVKSKVSKEKLAPEEHARTGTTVTFDPDPKIFTEITFNLKSILDHARQQAYLTKGIWLTVTDRREAPDALPYTFYFEGGIASYVRHINKERTAFNDPPFFVSKMLDDILVEVALAYTDDFNEHLFTFANNIHTLEGGTHLTGFKSALTRALNDYLRRTLGEKVAAQVLTGEDVREGLTAIVSVKLRDPQFEGQTKARLGNPEVRTAVESVTAEALTYYLDEHPSDARRIIEKATLSLRARLAARAARETIIRKGVLEGMTLPGKLADCSNRNPAETELFIVEGDSAGGTAKQGRDRRFQAILPLRGKILNVERARLDRILSSEEIKSLIVCMGIGAGEQVDYSKLRYHRIVIMTDADVDGAHIRTLLLTFLFRHYPDVIKSGYLYIAQPPLYAITRSGKTTYAYSDEEKNLVLKEMEAGTPEGKEHKPPSIQRYKGLGEMNAEQLWETTMNPENRMLLNVTIEDSLKADETFSMLMGNEVEPRKRFIQTHARSVENLDI